MIHPGLVFQLVFMFCLVFICFYCQYLEVRDRIDFDNAPSGVAPVPDLEEIVFKSPGDYPEKNERN
jgi:hypothetical protein